MVSHFDYKHRCLLEKNVPIALILPSRWQDGPESLGIEHNSCLFYHLAINSFTNKTQTIFRQFELIPGKQNYVCQELKCGRTFFTRIGQLGHEQVMKIRIHTFLCRLRRL